jgi:type VI secretion system secreted protein VgrG
MLGARVSFAAERLARLHQSALSVRGREAVNELYRFEIALAVAREDIEDLLAESGATDLESLLLGEAVSLAFGSGSGEPERWGVVLSAGAGRAVHGEVLGVPSVCVQLVVGPRAVLAQHRRRSRVFQDAYPHEIVSRVLAEYGVRHRWAFGNRYPRRLYCVQYDETDWDFVARLLAEEGVFFFFEHGAFAGGAVAQVPRSATWQETLGTVGTVAGAVGAGMAGMGGTLGVVGGIAGAVAEPLSEFAEDPELMNDSIVPSAGQSGAEGTGEILFITDTDRSYVRSAIASPTGDNASGPTLHLALREHTGAVSDAMTLDAFEPQRSIRPELVHVRDYMFRQPMMELRARHALEVAQRTPGARLEIYHHHGEYERPDVNAENARVLLEQHRADAARSLGHGTCPALAPGVVFQLENHGAGLFSDHRYAVTSIQHEWHAAAWATISHVVHPATSDVLARAAASDIAGTIETVPTHAGNAPSGTATPAPYRNVFDCIPDAVPARPRRPPRKTQTGVELATIVGPAGEEIFTDPFGRVKIQFHWDFEQDFTESSCWVRVVTPWAGTAYGMQFLPRVGMEVVVAFVGGDPDRPVVVGTLPNGTHPHLDVLPAHKTVSGIRTQSSPGGLGYNELAFDDAAGAEKVRIQAQRDLEEIVRHDATTSVGGNASTRVAGQRHDGVAGRHTVGVGSDHAMHVGGHHSTSVGGSQTRRVAGSSVEHVASTSQAAYDGMRIVTHNGSYVRSVAGTAVTHTMGSQLELVGGATRGRAPMAANVVDGHWIVN